MAFAARAKGTARDDGDALLAQQHGLFMELTLPFEHGYLGFGGRHVTTSRIIVAIVGILLFWMVLAYVVQSLA